MSFRALIVERRVPRWHWIVGRVWPIWGLVLVLYLALLYASLGYSVW